MMKRAMKGSSLTCHKLFFAYHAICLCLYKPLFIDEALYFNERTGGANIREEFAMRLSSFFPSAHIHEHYPGSDDILKRTARFFDCLFPTDFILFDAPMGYCHRATGKYIDFLICLDTPLDIALARRLLRDYRTHPDPQKILEELDYYLSGARPLFIMSPEEKASDLIIDGSLPIDSQEQEVLKVLDNIIHKKRIS